jgi:hypothetical protein
MQSPSALRPIGLLTIASGKAGSLDVVGHVVVAETRRWELLAAAGSDCSRASTTTRIVHAGEACARGQNELSKNVNRPDRGSAGCRWSGRWESNPRDQLGRLAHYHCATPACRRLVVARRAYGPDQQTRVAGKFGPLSRPIPHPAPSSSGLGRGPFKAEIAGSNPAGATTVTSQETLICAQRRSSRGKLPAVVHKTRLIRDGVRLVGGEGFEPPTSSMSSWRSPN